MSVMSYVLVHRAMRMEATSTTVSPEDLATVLLDSIEDDTGHRPGPAYIEVEHKKVLGVATVSTARWNPPPKPKRHARWDVTEEKWI